MAPVITFLVIFFLCLTCGVMVGEMYTLIVALGAGILFGFVGMMLVQDAINSTNTPEKRKKINRDVKRQDDYDNYWGIIDWHDR